MSKVTQEEHNQGALGNGPLPMVASKSDPRTSPTARPQKKILTFQNARPNPRLKSTSAQPPGMMAAPPPHLSVLSQYLLSRHQTCQSKFILKAHRQTVCAGYLEPPLPPPPHSNPPTSQPPVVQASPVTVSASSGPGSWLDAVEGQRAATQLLTDAT